MGKPCANQAARRQPRSNLLATLAELPGPVGSVGSGGVCPPAVLSDGRRLYRQSP